MLVELSRKEHHEIEHLIDSHTNVEAAAVIVGHSSGWVFVDRRENPRTALVWCKGMEGFYLLGDEENPGLRQGIDELVDTVISPRAKEMGYQWFEVSGIGDAWEDTIQDLFERRGLQSWAQRVYIYDRRSSPDTRPLADPSMRIVPIDAQLLSHAGAKSRSKVEKILLKYWETLEQFESQGFGYAVVSMQQVACLCFVSFRAKDSISISVETFDSSESFIGQGLARAVAAETIKRALRQGLRPHWDCTDTNVGIYRTAESLGLTLNRTYRCFGFLL